MVYTARRRDTMPVPVEPAVLQVYLVGPDTATVDIPVYVPWDRVRMTYCYTVTTVAEGDVNDVEIDLELNAASGTEIYTITVAQDSAVGDLDEGTLTTAAAARNLGRHDTARDAVNIEVASAGTTTWQGILFMYFEPDHS